MAKETTNALGECIYLCGKLKAKLNQDRATIEDSVRGELLDAYRQAIAEAVQRVDRVRNQLEILYGDVVVVENLQGV